MLRDTIAELIVGWRSNPLNPEVRHHTERAVLDWCGATIAGSTMPPASTLARGLEHELDAGPASLIPSGRRALPRAAALINATAAHTAEVDDIFRDGIYHPGAPTIAAALAAGQIRAARGDEFLSSVAIGFEVGTRIAAAINPTHYRFWHTTGTVGAIGAAVAAASILGCGRDEIADAIGTATTLAAGLQQAFRSEAMSKPLHAGHAADVGMLAALGASAGLTSAEDVLEGERGFAAAMAEGADLSSAFRDPKLGNINRITFKNHVGCGHTFAPVDAALLLASEHGFTADDIQRIDVATYAVAIEVAGNPSPRTSFEAKFSIQHAVAAAFALGSVRLRAFTDEALVNPTIRRLRDGVRLEIDDAIDATFPKQRAARVAIELTDGRTLVHLAPTRRGDPDAPLTDEELEDKFAELAAPAVGEEAARKVADLVWQIHGMTRVTDLLDELASTVRA